MPTLLDIMRDRSIIADDYFSETLKDLRYAGRLERERELNFADVLTQYRRRQNEGTRTGQKIPEFSRLLELLKEAGMELPGPSFIEPSWSFNKGI